MVALRASLDVPHPRGLGAGTTRRPVVAPAHQWPLHRPRMDHRLGVQPGPDHAATRNLEQPGPRRAPARRDHPRDGTALHAPRFPGPDTGGFPDLDPATRQDRTPEARAEPPGSQRERRERRERRAGAGPRGGSPLLKLEALQKANPKFRKSWEQDRKDMADQSPSAYDMSLATMAIQAGWSD